MNLENNEDLKHLNYDVESYYKYVNYTDEMVDKDLRLELIKAAIYSDSSVLLGKFSLLEHKDILDGMVGLLGECFGEEVLYDYASSDAKEMNIMSYDLLFYKNYGFDGYISKPL